MELTQAFVLEAQRCVDRLGETHSELRRTLDGSLVYICKFINPEMVKIVQANIVNKVVCTYQGELVRSVEADGDGALERRDSVTNEQETLEGYVCKKRKL